MKRNDINIKTFVEVDLDSLNNISDYRVERVDGDLLIIAHDNKYGLAKKDGTIIKEPIYKSIGKFNNSIALVECYEGRNYGVINNFGNIILSSISELRIDGNFIVEELYSNFNNIRIYDKMGNLIIKDIDNYSNNLFLKKVVEDENYYAVYDINNNKIDVIKNYNKEDFIVNGIIKCYDKKKIVKIINNLEAGVKIEKIKAKEVKILDENKRLILTLHDQLQLLDNNKIILQMENKEIEIDYKYKIIIVGYLLRTITDYESLVGYSGFITPDNKYIKTNFQFYQIPLNNRMIIKNDSQSGIIDFKGHFLIPYTNGSINYDKKNNIYIMHNENNYKVLDINFKQIFECKTEAFKVITKDIFLIKSDNKICLIKSDNQIIKKFDCDINCIDIKQVNNLLKIVINNRNMVINDTGNTIVPLVDNNIIILDNDSIIIDNFLLNLNDEYLNVKINYTVSFELYGKKIVKRFNNQEDEKKYIERLKKILLEYDNLLNKLQGDTLNNIEKEYYKIKEKKNEV